MSLRGYFATSKSHKISPLVLFPLRLHLCRVRLWTPSHLFHTFCTHPCPLHFLREKWEKLKTKIIEKKDTRLFSLLPSFILLQKMSSPSKNRRKQLSQSYAHESPQPAQIFLLLSAPLPLPHARAGFCPGCNLPNFSASANLLGPGCAVFFWVFLPNVGCEMCVVWKNYSLNSLNGKHIFSLNGGWVFLQKNKILF